MSMPMSMLPRVLNTFQLNTPTIRLKQTSFGGLALVKPFYESAANAYASYAFNIAGQRLNSPTHPVTWLNTKTRMPALTINMLSDTGADYSTLDAKYAPQLGINLKSGTQATVQGTGGTVGNTFYIHSIPFKIGTLPPYTAQVAMGTGHGTDVFGRTAGLNWFNIQYTKDVIRYTELNKVNSAFAQSKRWRY